MKSLQLCILEQKNKLNMQDGLKTSGLADIKQLQTVVSSEDNGHILVKVTAV